MKQQLTSNTCLWEQLVESEKREKILKQELERSQAEIATQEKIIERLKDDIKREAREKQKLIQYKTTKSKRLDELETKAREFEVLQSINLSKLLGLLENKEAKIQSLKGSEGEIEEKIKVIEKLNGVEVNRLRRQLTDESQIKMEVMQKLENMRHELQMI